VHYLRPNSGEPRWPVPGARRSSSAGHALPDDACRSLTPRGRGALPVSSTRASAGAG
jgi:hypothetical protein